MREQLETAQRDARVVSIDRVAFEEEDEIGYVLDVGATLFLIARVADTLHLDGYSVLRIGDVSHVELPYEHEEFVESALRLREESIANRPSIPLDDWPGAIRSASRDHELLSLHSESVEEGACRIGRVRSVREDVIQLIEIDPDADWYDEATGVDIDSLTRMDFGGAYEEALLLVGGPCPVPILRAVD